MVTILIVSLSLLQQQPPTPPQLTSLSPPQPQSPPPAPLSPALPDYSVKSMELTPPLHTSIIVRKRPLETEEEEELEFHPLAASTPNVSSYTVPDILIVYITTGKKPS